MSFMEQFEKTARKVLSEAEQAAHKAIQKAGEATEANRDKIDAALDKAGQFVDQKTDGKYASHIEKAKDAAGKGVDFVAARKDHVQTSSIIDEQGVQDVVRDQAPPAGPTAYPSPIPPYTPPTH